MPGVIGFYSDIVSPALCIEGKRDSFQTIEKKDLKDCSKN